jgi:hypothetical protein
MIATASHRVTRRLVDWVRVSESEWRSGNVRLIRVHGTPDEYNESWLVKIRRNNRWQWAHSSQRPWGYGSASQAKRGVPKWKNIVFKRVKPD